MLTEIQYRTFDELLQSVEIDMKGVDSQGYVEPQELLKVAIKVNRELGLKVNPTRQKCIEIHKGKARLPEDFHVLNFALVCESRNEHPIVRKEKTYNQGLLEGVLMAQNILSRTSVDQFTITMDLQPNGNLISHTLNTMDVIVQAQLPDGTLASFDFSTPSVGEIILDNDTAQIITGVKIIIIGKKSITNFGSQQTHLQNDDDNNPTVTYIHNNVVNTYKRLVPIEIKPSRKIMNDCWNLTVKSHYIGYLENGFFHVNFDEGTIYLNYSSVMEDDAGNLLVFDHPIVNEYYEYALKERIFENMFLSGESAVQNKLQFISQKLRMARNNAFSYVNTPDFNELKRVWEMNRKAQYHNYYNMFKSNIR
jgi:hypothetical protein